MNGATRAGLPPVVVLGQGPVAWGAALALARSVPTARRPVRVLVDPADAPPAGAVALHPPTEDWRPALALDDARVVNRAAGSFSFGAALSGWSAPGRTYFHPFSSFGAPIGPVPFYPIALRLREAGVPMRLANFSLAALAAQSNRFQRPDRAPGSVLSTCRHGVHADAAGLAALLREDALAAGVEVVDGTLEAVERDGSQSITGLRLDGDRTLEGGLYLDTTGRLQAEDSEWEDWSDFTPWNRTLRARVRTVGTPPPYRHLEVLGAGWLEHLPLHGSTALQAWYRAGRADDEGADEAMLERVRAAAGSQALDSVAFETWRPGRRTRPWRGNCVALGDAALALEPLGPGGFHLARTALQRLLTLMPGDGPVDAVRDEYNRRTALEQAHARDFVLAHYRLNGRRGEAPWDDARDGETPPGLAHRQRVFEARATVPLGDEEPLEADAWLNLFDEHGLAPRHGGPLAAGVDLETLAHHAEKVRAFMLGALKTLPSHEDTLVSLRVVDGELESTIESVNLAAPGGAATPT